MRTWFIRSVTGAILASSLATSLPALAVDMFIKLGEIKGESVDDKHKGDIDVLAWSWGVSQPAARTGTGVAGKATVNALVLTKFIDASSPLLFQSAVQGTQLKEAVFVARKTGGRSAVEFIKIRLKGVSVASVKPAGSAGQDRFTEEITLVFSSAEYTYVTQKPDGTAGPAVSASWGGPG